MKLTLVCFSIFALTCAGGALGLGCTSKNTQSDDDALRVGLTRRIEKQTRIQDRVDKLLKEAEKGTLTEQETAVAFLYADNFLLEKQYLAAAKLLRGIFQSSPSLPVSLRLVRVEAALGNVEKAEEIARKAALYHPKSPDPILSLAFLQRLRGAKDESEESLARAYSKHSRNESVASRYVESLLESGKSKQAIVVLKRAIGEVPQPSFFLLRLARIYAEEKDYKNAKELLNQLLKIDPDNTDGWTLAGFIAVEEKDFPTAERFFREAYEKQPDNEVLARYFVTQLLRQRKYAESRRLLSRLEQTAEDPQTFDAELSFQLAYVLLELGEVKESRERFLKLLENAADKGRMLFFLGQCDEAEKSLELARKNYTKVTEDSDFFDDARQRIVFLHLEQGQFKEAKEKVEQYVLKNKESEQDLRFIAHVFARIKDHQRALKIVESALEKFPKSVDLMYLRAVYLEHTSSKSASLEALEKFLKAHPSHAQALNHLGYSLADMGQRVEFARELLYRAIKAEPKNGFYLDSLGWAYAKLGKHTEAEKFLLQALALEPEEPIILEHLGEVKLMKNDKALALRYFERAQEIFGKNPKWRVENDSEWQTSQKNVEKRVRELRAYALGNPQ
jgi:tetratricopeptide (TPR) repeat protein